MPVHDVAHRGFDSGAAAYDRARPSYPPERSRGSSTGCQLRPSGVTCCDLAAGTGKPPALLVPSGARLLAVEPVEGMRELLQASLPGVAAIAGTAEALPFRDAALDAVTIAQAFHWFDADRAFAELSRVVHPGGGVALIWNARDRSVDWVDALWSIMDRVEKRAPWRDHERWSDSALGDRHGFGPLVEAVFHHGQLLDVQGVLDRFASVSHVRGAPRRRARRGARRGPRGARDAPRHPGPFRGRDPLPRRRLLVRTDGVSLRTSIAITAGRAAGWLSRVSGRGQGATISGRVMNAIAPDLLAELAADQHVAVVSATNGKTTTTRLLAAAVGADGRPLVSNSTGANLTSGIAPTLARADGPGTAVLEVDERRRRAGRRPVGGGAARARQPQP